ncbi:MAG: GNAT family N-acetyltransferase [Muribaculaceae bacterium]|nr:GNAT family N-acetyltransferase [Muribaculaceae bacterium]
MKESRLSYPDYLSVADSFNHKGTISNDYLTHRAEKLAQGGKLSAVIGKDNLFIIEDKDGFKQLYFYLNNPQEILALPEGVITAEILFRAGSVGIETETDYLKQCGMQLHILRDNYSMTLKTDDSGFSRYDDAVRDAESIEEVACSFDLFNRVFDRYTGDYVAPSFYPAILEAKDIGVAIDKETGRLMGAVHRSLEGKTVNLSHIAVDSDFRSRGIGKKLLDYFIDNNHRLGASRFTLWVQNLNVIAKKMYEDYGFKYTNRSSQSLIKK